MAVKAKIEECCDDDHLMTLVFKKFKITLSFISQQQPLKCSLRLRTIILNICKSDKPGNPNRASEYLGKQCSSVFKAIRLSYVDYKNSKSLHPHLKQPRAAIHLI